MSSEAVKLDSLHYDPVVTLLRRLVQRADDLKTDPELTEGLRTALQYAKMRDDYTLACTSEMSPACKAITEATLRGPWQQLEQEGKTMDYLESNMLSGHLEGEFLKSLLSANGSRRVLDVGTYTGFSALSMAEALPLDGQLVTLDVEPFLQQHNQPFFQASPHGHKITMKIGPAVQSMREMAQAGQQFDFIFVDAVKAEYIEYFKIAFDEGLLAPNGTIAADNAYMFGESYLPNEDPNHPCRLFCEYVTKDERLHKVLVPIRDGVLLIRRLSDVIRDPAK